jgi:hypothetical protein
MALQSLTTLDQSGLFQTQISIPMIGVTQSGKFITELWGVELHGNSDFPYFTVAVNREAK